MPRRADIHRILVIGSGPIVIGQAAEFDYSGTQATKALREEGYEVILINSNPATIMTDPEIADRTYIEPVTAEFVELIIEREKPDALLPTMGGQTALNVAMQLSERGVLAKHGVELIGASARAIAIAEDRAVFHGYPVAGIRGICEQASASVEISGAKADYPSLVTHALNKLRDEGVDGPFAVALSERSYTELTELTDGGYPVLQHVQRLIDGPLVWAPGLDGAVVLSMRGGDFELTVGQDFSIGYLDHTAKTVTLYLEESFTFQVLSPQAAVRLAYSDGKKK